MDAQEGFAKWSKKDIVTYLEKTLKERDHWEKQSHALKEENDKLAGKLALAAMSRVADAITISTMRADYEELLQELEEIRNDVGDTPAKAAGHTAVTCITKVISKYKRPTPAEDDPSDGA